MVLQRPLALAAPRCAAHPLCGRITEALPSSEPAVAPPPYPAHRPRLDARGELQHRQHSAKSFTATCTNVVPTPTPAPDRFAPGQVAQTATNRHRRFHFMSTKRL